MASLDYFEAVFRKKLGKWKLENCGSSGLFKLDHDTQKCNFRNMFKPLPIRNVYNEVSSNEAVTSSQSIIILYLSSLDTLSSTEKTDIVLKSLNEQLRHIKGQVRLVR